MGGEKDGPRMVVAVLVVGKSTGDSSLILPLSGGSSGVPSDLTSGDDGFLLLSLSICRGLTSMGVGDRLCCRCLLGWDRLLVLGLGLRRCGGFVSRSSERAEKS
jgi:hypothetical protein